MEWLDLYSDGCSMKTGGYLCFLSLMKCQNVCLTMGFDVESTTHDSAIRLTAGLCMENSEADTCQAQSI